MKRAFIILVLMVGIALGFGGGWYLERYSLPWANDNLLSPLVNEYLPPAKPLQQYSISNLADRTYVPSSLIIENSLLEADDYTSYLFSYTTTGRKMTGVLNIPVDLPTAQQPKVIVMLRGYVDPSVYQSGVGTKNAAAVLAKQGFVTVAPDFFGYGQSEAEAADTWEARFIKPVNVIELIKSIQSRGLPQSPITTFPATSELGIWAHSNGGQIALTVLEILQQPIPTTLWAPVTAPFPYSVLFFSDEAEDEGKDMRKYVSIFEKDYDAFDFSLTKHLDHLTGSILLHHGTADEAALKIWSDEFVDKVSAENKRRKAITHDETATTSAEIPPLPAIDLTYHVYPGADHNLQPGWDTAVSRDIEFFKEKLQIPI